MRDRRYQSGSPAPVAENGDHSPHPPTSPRDPQLAPQTTQDVADRSGPLASWHGPTPIPSPATVTANAAQMPDSFYAYFVDLCQRHQPPVDPTMVARECEFSHATITHWRKAGAAPNPLICRRIAAYFDEPYPLVLLHAGHLRREDLWPWRDPQTLRQRLSPTPEAAKRLGIREDEAAFLPVAETPAPFTDDELVQRAKLSVAQVPGLPPDAVAAVARLIDQYTMAARLTNDLTPPDASPSPPDSPNGLGHPARR